MYTHTHTHTHRHTYTRARARAHAQALCALRCWACSRHLHKVSWWKHKKLQWLVCNLALSLTTCSPLMVLHCNGGYVVYARARARVCACVCMRACVCVIVLAWLDQPAASTSDPPFRRQVSRPWSRCTSVIGAMSSSRRCVSGRPTSKPHPNARYSRSLLTSWSAFLLPLGNGGAK